MANKKQAILYKKVLHESHKKDVEFRVKSVTNNNETNFSKKQKDGVIHKDESCHPIMMAIYNSSYCQAKLEIESLTSYDLNNMSYAGQSPLHASCEVKSLLILKLLLQKGAKTNILNSVGNTPLHTAVLNSWKEGVQELLFHGCNCNTITETNLKIKEIVRHSPLQMAVKQGNISLINVFMEHSPNLTQVDDEGQTLLHLAAYSRCVTIIKLLMGFEECKKGLAISDINGNTPLHSLLKVDKVGSCDNKIVKCVKLFIEEGINVNSKNDFAETSLYLACKNDFPNVVEYLLKMGADPILLTMDRKSTVHSCCKAGSKECLKRIIDTGKVEHLIMQEDEDNLSPFHYAVSSYSIECCELLLNNGDHLTHIDRNGVTRCSLVLLNLPNAQELLTRVFDAGTKVSSKQMYDPSFCVIFNYSTLFCKKSETVQKSIINELTGPRFENLLKHPLLESFLYIKWGLIKPFFYLGVLNYFIFIVIHTYFVMKTYGGMNMVNWSLDEYYHALATFKALHVVMFLLILIPDFLLTLGQFKKYLTQIDCYIKIVTIFTSGFIVFMPMEKYDILCQRNIAAISLLFGWCELMLLLGKFPKFGVYVLMFLKISKSIIKFLVAFSFILLGYACAFEIVFSGIDVFKTLPLTLLKTLMMMIGEIDYGYIYEKSNFTRLFQKGENVSIHVYGNDFLRLALLISFVFLVSVLMTNLLIGLAVNNLPDLQRQGKIRRLAKQASYVVSYERLILCFKIYSFIPCIIRKILFRHYKICCEVSLYPNKKDQSAKRHLRIPTEILNEAIAIAAKAEEIKDLCTAKDDLETQFRDFQKQYNKDRKLIETKLLKEEENQDDRNQPTTDNEILQLLLNIQQELKDQKILIRNLQNNLNNQ